jgi:chromosomal replication initiator protein
LVGNEVLQWLKRDVDEVEYQRYIKQLSFKENVSTENLYIYDVPNLILAKFIKTKFAKKMLHKIEASTGQKPDIQFIVQNSLQTNVNSNQVLQVQDKKKSNSTLLEPTHTFETFVTGPSNQFAYTAMKRASEKPGDEYNILFLYGGTGLGKTHLLHAIGNENILKSKNVIYMTSEQLLNDYTSSISHKTLEKFRLKYRSCDILLVDDIQFLSGKENYQEEFFHTFEELKQKNKLIVLTSDRTPKELPDIADRLKSRFEWGLTMNIQPLELETKIGIIKKKCEIENIQLNNEIITHIATNLNTNVREIEGILTNLKTHANMLKQDITLQLAKNILKDHIKEQRKNITIEDIIDIISQEFNIKPSELKSSNRQAKTIKAKHSAIYLAKILTKNTNIQVAKFFNMKNHSSVSKTMNKIEEEFKKDINYKNQVEEIKNKILTK